MRMRGMSRVGWWSYVEQVTEGAAGEQIARRLEVSGATVSRWKTVTPRPEMAARFAREYGRPVLEAFVAAGFLTGIEAGEAPVHRDDPEGLSNDELLAELARRLDGKTFPENADTGQESPLGSPETSGIVAPPSRRKRKGRTADDQRGSGSESD